MLNPTISENSSKLGVTTTSHWVNARLESFVSVFWSQAAAFSANVPFYFRRRVASLAISNQMSTFCWWYSSVGSINMWTPVGTGVVWIRIKSDLDESLFGLFEHDCINSHCIPTLAIRVVPPWCGPTWEAGWWNWPSSESLPSGTSHIHHQIQHGSQ